jgi:hypothetical protein
MAAVKLPLLTSFCGGLLLFTGSAYVGYNGAARFTYRYKQAGWFSSLEKQDAQQLRKTTNALTAFELSRLLIQNTRPSLQYNVASLAKIRGEAPHELWPILDLRLAKDYATMARLEEQDGDTAAATRYRQSSVDLLKSLGWQDLSDAAITTLGENELHSRLKR